MSQGYTKGIPIDTDGTLSANSDLLVSSQKAVKTYVDTEIANIPAPTTPDLEAILTAGNDGGGLEITNISDPTSAQSAATKDYVDTSCSYTISFTSVPVVHSENETSERVLATITIPANTLVAGDFVAVEVMARKTSGASGTVALRARVGSSIGTGGTQMTGVATINLNSMVIRPMMYVVDASNQIVYPEFANGAPYSVGGANQKLTTLDTTQPIYICITDQKTVGTDLMELRVATANIIKNRP